MSIELRLSDVEPPASEPKRTIYRDIVNLPSTVKLGLTIRYFNHDDVDLYFQITGSGTGYTFGTVNLGLLASGANAYQNLDEFASRAKPSASDLPNGEMEENITLTLKAYTDSGYSNLKWTYERIVTVHWINSADAAFTVDVLNNFDDGTVQGWAVANELNNSGSLAIGVVTDYVLSTPYSCRMHQSSSSSDQLVRARLYKSFTTPNRTTVYAIANIRTYPRDPSYPAYPNYNKNLIIKNTDTTLLYIGRLGDSVLENYFPESKWMRLVVPLPANTTVAFRIVHECYIRPPTYMSICLLWLDDFKLISK